MSHPNRQFTWVRILHDVESLDLPLSLNDDLKIADCSNEVPSLDLDWLEREGVVPKQYLNEIRTEWKNCLIHEFSEPDIKPEESDRIVWAVLSVLRLQAFGASSTKNIIHCRPENGKLGVLSERFDCDKQGPFATDYQFFKPITLEVANIIKRKVDTLKRVAMKPRDAYPLFLSLYLSERAFFTHEWEVQFLFRMMAIEALFSDEALFGKRALESRLTRFIPDSVDLYEPFREHWIMTANKLELSPLIEDLCKLRNKIAHGDQSPSGWAADDQEGLEGPICRRKLLCFSAMSVLSIVWRKILSENLETVFEDKVQMAAHFA